MKKLFVLLIAVTFSIPTFAQNWYEININTDKRLNAINFPSAARILTLPVTSAASANPADRPTTAASKAC